MSSRTATIASSVGLHARPAALFVKKATAAGVPVTIGKKGGKTVNAGFCLDHFSGCAAHGRHPAQTLQQQSPHPSTTIKITSSKSLSCQTRASPATPGRFGGIPS